MYEKCTDCDYLSVYRDSNEEIVLTRCGHPDNPDDREGNNIEDNCPKNRQEKIIKNN